MNINAECIPCYFRQALQAAGFVTQDRAVWWELLHKVSEFVSTLGPDSVSHDASGELHRIVRETTGCDDPYKGVKDEYNQRALAVLPDARARVLAAADPLEAAVRMSIAGNVVDFGAETFLDFDHTLANIMEKPFADYRYEQFRDAVDKAQTVLFLGDNTGEIVLDRLLLEQLAPRSITFAARGGPILNDATPADARAAGIHEHAEIIDTGATSAGVPMDRVSRRFLDIFESADLIISKGQANFESLCKEPRENLFFLYTIKCRLVARYTRTQVGDIMLSQGGHVKLHDV